MQSWINWLIHVYRQFYDLREGTLQLAKLSKVLLAFEKGRLAEFIDDININPDECDAPMPLPQDNAGQVDEEREKVQRSNKKVRDIDAPLSLPQENAGQNGPFKRTPWTSNEICAVEKRMMSFIKSWKVPGKAECERCIEAEPLALQNRDWLAVKFYVKNRITALHKKWANVKKRDCFSSNVAQFHVQPDT
ncbi:hypothetical protein NFI96_007494, partial [Prochilodus magdalenae]